MGQGCNRFRHQQNILAAPGQAQGGRQGRSCSDPAATTQATHPPPTTRVMCGDNSTVWVGWGWGGGGVQGGRGMWGFRNRGFPEWGWSRWESQGPRRSLGGRPPPSSARGTHKSIHQMDQKLNRTAPSRRSEMLSPSGFPLGPQTT